MTYDLSAVRFGNGQIVVTGDIASVGPIRRDYTYPGDGRAYFEITYKQGGTVKVPSNISDLTPPYQGVYGVNQFINEYETFLVNLTGYLSLLKG